MHRKLLSEDASGSTASLPPSPNTSTATNPTTHVARFDSSMIIAAVVLLTALFLISLCYMYSRRSATTDFTQIIRRPGVHHRRPSSSSPSSAPGSTQQNLQISASPSIVPSVPLTPYADTNAKGRSDCAVCLGDFDEKETVKEIPWCGHVFHPQCIDTWFSCHVSCPLCRSTHSRR